MGSLSIYELATILYQGTKTSKENVQKWLDDNCNECLEGDEELTFAEWVERVVQECPGADEFQTPLD